MHAKMCVVYQTRKIIIIWKHLECRSIGRAIKFLKIQQQQPNYKYSEISAFCAYRSERF